MEQFSRRVLIALVVAAAGPGAALLTMMLIAPTLVGATAPETDGDFVAVTGSLLMGLLIGGMISTVIAYVVGSGATMVALRATRCPNPHVALILCMVLSPPWFGVLSSLDLDLTSLMMMLAVLPGGIRLAFGEQKVPDDRTGDLVPPSSPSQIG